MSKIVYHPGTGTILDVAECMVFDTADLEGQGYDDMEETLQNVDVAGIDLGVLLGTVERLSLLARGVEISQFLKSGNN